MAKSDEDACWFKRLPTPEGGVEEIEDWEEGTLRELDQHGMHGYAALIVDDFGEILVIPFKDVLMGADKPAPKKERDKEKEDKKIEREKAKAKDKEGGTRHEGIEHPKQVLKSPDVHKGHETHR